MAPRPIPRPLLRAAVAAVAKHGSILRAARALGWPEPTLRHRLEAAERAGLAPPAPSPRGEIEAQRARDAAKAEAKHQQELRAELEREVARLTRERDALAMVRGWSKDLKPPSWTIDEDRRTRGSPGVPTAFWSDWHWGEVVDPEQIGGVNRYDLATANARAKHLVESTVDLLTKHVVNPSYPGMCLVLGGDFLSGDIHEELKKTNEVPVPRALLDVQGVLIQAIEKLVERFHRVSVYCVPGNHGRTTHKVEAKDFAYTNMDWLLYQELALHFKSERAVQFAISPGTDLQFRLFSTSYQLTHGNQFRGGSGIAGMLSPLLLGDHRKRKVASATRRPYDYLLLGHWHQWAMVRGLIVNGSLKGYDEYAAASNFDFEPPRQGLWLTHPRHGITISMPVLCERQAADAQATWTSWRAA